MIEVKMPQLTWNDYCCSKIQVLTGLTPYMKLPKLNSEPQNRRISNIECRRVESLCSVFFKIGRIHYFDIRHSLFDIRYSLFQSFFSI